MLLFDGLSTAATPGTRATASTVRRAAMSMPAAPDHGDEQRHHQQTGEPPPARQGRRVEGQHDPRG